MMIAAAGPVAMAHGLFAFASLSRSFGHALVMLSLMAAEVPSNWSQCLSCNASAAIAGSLSGGQQRANTVVGQPCDRLGASNLTAAALNFLISAGMSPIADAPYVAAAQIPVRNNFAAALVCRRICNARVTLADAWHNLSLKCFFALRRPPPSPTPRSLCCLAWEIGKPLRANAA